MTDDLSALSLLVETAVQDCRDRKVLMRMLRELDAPTGYDQTASVLRYYPPSEHRAAVVRITT